MAAVPPSSEDVEPDAVAFGIAALDDRIRETDISFPVAAETLVAELDDPEIPYDVSGRSIDLSTAIDRADLERFESRRDLLNSLHPVFEAERNSGGLGEWLKRLFSL